MLVKGATGNLPMHIYASLSLNELSSKMENSTKIHVGLVFQFNSHQYKTLHPLSSYFPPLLLNNDMS